MDSQATMIKTLCVPCVKGLEGRWKTIRQSGNSLKATCDLCQRRRYCGRWALEPLNPSDTAKRR